MEYEWDEAKRRANLAKHGVDFAAAEGFEWETATIQPDLRRDYGETRFRAFGLINDMLHCWCSPCVTVFAGSSGQAGKPEGGNCL